jgi:hypothetical protein
MEYNDIWTRDKYKEYRRLKRNGYSDKMLMEHFGEDIFHSGMYRKGAGKFNMIKYIEFVNEIKISPEQVEYRYQKQPSIFYNNRNDYVISFYSNERPYIISLLYYPISDIETYNIVFTTRDQWNEYEYKCINFTQKGFLNEEEFELLDNIIGKETKLNELFPLFRKMSWIIIDFWSKVLKDVIFSIGETKNEKKINFYRNIIKYSFPNMEESILRYENTDYFIYKIRQ